MICHIFLYKHLQTNKLMDLELLLSHFHSLQFLFPSKLEVPTILHQTFEYHFCHQDLSFLAKKVFLCIFEWFLDMRLFCKILDKYRIFCWNKIFLVLLHCNLVCISKYFLSHQYHIVGYILIIMMQFWEFKRQWTNLKTKLNV